MCAGEPLSLDWKALADPSATLAIYMGRGAAPETAARLIENSLASDTPVLVAANVSLPGTIQIGTRLDLLPLAVKSIDQDAPALLLIGRAIALHAELPCRAEFLIHSTLTGRKSHNIRRMEQQI
jgi:uroporphyrin-III C-methyltransferase